LETFEIHGLLVVERQLRCALTYRVAEHPLRYVRKNGQIRATVKPPRLCQTNALSGKEGCKLIAKNWNAEINLNH